jgi:glycosyltransferase involved in cell wall biosynthesis
VLFVAPALPWPANSGGRIRTSQLIEHAGCDARITLFAVSPPGPQASVPPSLSAACERIEVFERTRPSLLARLALSKLERSFHSHHLHSAVQAALSERAYDLVHIDELSVARAVGFTANAPVLVHHHKLDARLATALAEQRLGVSHGEVARVRALEHKVCRAHSSHATCSEEEASALEEQYGVSCAVIPNGVDEERHKPDDTPLHPETLLFIGTLSYEPNIHGLEWFVTEVLPILRAARPTVQLKIVGLDPTPRVSALSRDGVEVIGPVRDTLGHLCAAACSIAPLFIGGGTRIKILESLAVGCPVVSTSVGAEGLGLSSRALSIADGADAFSAALLSILEDPAAARAGARAGSQEIRDAHSWGASASALLEAWEACAARTLS